MTRTDFIESRPQLVRSLLTRVLLLLENKMGRKSFTHRLQSCRLYSISYQGKYDTWYLVRTWLVCTWSEQQHSLFNYCINPSSVQQPLYDVRVPSVKVRNASNSSFPLLDSPPSSRSGHPVHVRSCVLSTAVRRYAYNSSSRAQSRKTSDKKRRLRYCCCRFTRK